MDGTQPTGRTVAYPGASFTQVEGDKIRSEHTYLDRQTVAEQLGLKAQARRSTRRISVSRSKFCKVKFSFGLLTFERVVVRRDEV